MTTSMRTRILTLLEAEPAGLTDISITQRVTGNRDHICRERAALHREGLIHRIEWRPDRMGRLIVSAWAAGAGVDAAKPPCKPKLRQPYAVIKAQRQARAAGGIRRAALVPDRSLEEVFGVGR